MDSPDKYLNQKLLVSAEKLVRCWQRSTISNGWFAVILKIAFFFYTARYCSFILAAPSWAANRKTLFTVYFSYSPVWSLKARVCSGRRVSTLTGNWLPFSRYRKAQRSRIYLLGNPFAELQLLLHGTKSENGLDMINKLCSGSFSPPV